jgi:putative transcriptional regulator
MSADFASTQLSHHFLIAMPGLEDPTFARSVVYLCEHSERGAMGLIINKPGELSLKHLFDKVELTLHREDLLQSNVLHGGPVQMERGFVLHEPMLEADSENSEAGSTIAFEANATACATSVDTAIDKPTSDAKNNSIYASTLSVPGGLALTTSKDVLEAIANGSGPKRVLVTLGYASWGEGQLESEIVENSWITVAADPRVIFETPIEQRYEKALALLGLQPWMLLTEAGHA